MKVTPIHAMAHTISHSVFYLWIWCLRWKLKHFDLEKEIFAVLFFGNEIDLYEVLLFSMTFIQQCDATITVINRASLPTAGIPGHKANSKVSCFFLKHISTFKIKPLNWMKDSFTNFLLFSCRLVFDLFCLQFFWLQA